MYDLKTCDTGNQVRMLLGSGRFRGSSWNQLAEMCTERVCELYMSMGIFAYKKMVLFIKSD